MNYNIWCDFDGHRTPSQCEPFAPDCFCCYHNTKTGALQGTGGWWLLDDGSIHSVWWSIFNSMEKWLNNLLPHCSHFTQFSSERVPINIDQNCTKNPPTLTQYSWAESIKWYLNWRVVTPKVSANQILLLQWCVSPLGCCVHGSGDRSESIISPSPSLSSHNRPPLLQLWY